MENRQFIGIEKNEDVLLHKKTFIDYIDLSERRIGAAKKKYAEQATVLQLWSEPTINEQV